MAKKRRKPKRHLVPRTRAGNTWTESEFWSFIRSNLRKMSQKWPPKNTAKNRVRVKYNGTDKRRKWSYRCERCHKLFKGTEVECHHKIPCGSCKSFEDIGPFIKRLLVEIDGWEILCEECHVAEHKS